MGYENYQVSHKHQDGMKWVFAIIASLAFYSSYGYGDTYKGVAVYAAMSPRFPCQNALESLESVLRPSIGMLYGTFGKSLDCLGRFFTKFKDKPHLAIVYLSNEYCRRHRVCSSNDLLPKTSINGLNRALEKGRPKALRSFKSRANRLLAFINQHSNANSRVILIPGLEDNFTTKAWQVLRYNIASGWPYEIGRNSIYKTAFYGSGIICEYHSLRYRDCPGGKPSLGNLDGRHVYRRKRPGFANEVSVRRVKQWINGAPANYISLLLWRRHWQGYRDEFVEPSLRTFRFNRQDINLVKEVYDSKGL